MALRTIQVIGKAYAEAGTVTIHAVVNGTTVFNGVVPTTAGLPPIQTNDIETLFQFDVPDTMYGIVVPSSFTVTGGTAYIAGISANNIIPNDLAAFDPLWQFAPSLKTNIKLDGTLIDAVEPEDGWHYGVQDGSTMTIDWNLPELKFDIPGHMKLPVTDMIVGAKYRIHFLGNTDFTPLGSANNNLYTIFTCTQVGVTETSPLVTGIVYPVDGELI